MELIHNTWRRWLTKPCIWVCFILALSAGIVIKNTGNWHKTHIFRWDVIGYYNYIPSIFIYDDLQKVAFYPEISRKYKPTGDIHNYGLYQIEGTEHTVNKYSCGVAIFELPTFFLAHAYALQSKTYTPDGYSPPYQLAVCLNTLLFAILGLLLIRLLLLNMGYTSGVTAIVLAILGFGTNIFYYISIAQGMAHIYSFFLLAVILWCTYRLMQQERLRYFIGIGLALGLATIVRPIDVLFGLLPTLWIASKQNIWAFIRQNPGKIGMALLCFFVATSPQLLYWKHVTGDWIHYSYKGESFDFTNSQIMNGLFSYRKGWYLYTPLAFLGTLYLITGCFKGRHRHLFRASTLLLAIYIYVVFSWWMWYYGGSYGARVMINVLPLLAVPLAACIRQIKTSGLLIKISSGAIISLFVALNLFQTFQYYRGTIHWDAMNKEYYWRVFLKEYASPEDLEYLYKK